MGSFRYEDPFVKDRDLIYKHIGFTKRVTWLYQDVLLFTVVILIVGLRLNKYYKNKSSNLTRRVTRYLLSDSPVWNDYFNSNMNLWIIGVYYSVNIFVSVVDLPMDDSFNLALRFGLVAMSNIPILYLLPLKASIFSLDLSYENLIIYHKAIGVLVLITSLIHTGAFMYCLSWTYLFTSLKALTGFYMMGAYLVIGLTSIVFVRRYVYELFYTLHVLASYSFLPFCYRHHYVCKPFVALVTISLIFDKLVKISKTFITDCNVISSQDNENDLLIEITKPKNFTWKSTNHLYINIPRISLFQTHPLTIANLPDSSNKILLIIKINNGFTKKLYKKSLEQKHFKCLIHGPYGISHKHVHFKEFNGNSRENIRFSISEESEIIEAPSNQPIYPNDNQTNELLPKDQLKKESRVSYGSVDSSMSNSTVSVSDANKSIIEERIEIGSLLRTKYLLISAGSGITFILPILLSLVEYEKRWKIKLNFKFVWILRDDSIIDLLLPEIKELLGTKQVIPNTQIVDTGSSTHVSPSGHMETLIELDNRIKIWYTSKQGRPDLQEVLYNTNDNNIESDYGSRSKDNDIEHHLKIFACGPNGFINNVKKFGIDQVSTTVDVDLILEQFSF